MSPSTATNMEGTGMVAVVRGLQDSGLAVTLLDNGKQYTLVPQNEARRSEASGAQCSMATNYSSYLDSGVFCNSAAQATDGRYASVYKTTHCNVKPTTPPVALTEFPPQRASVCRGQSNFVVGGTGSGDTTYNPVRSNGAFRGAMSWSDRDSVFSPRPSRQPDAFANSLRKYPPAISPDRSTEIVERLINYTQAKNFNKNLRYQNSSPTRNNLNPLDQIDLDRRMSPKRTFAPEVNVRIRQRTEESPTRGPRRDYDVDYRRGMFGKNYDVRYLRDVSKKLRENIRGMCDCPYHQPVCPNMQERYEMPLHEQRTRDVGVPYKVNTEIQAAAKMVCREVATTPRVEPPKRNVAVPMSPASSDFSENSEGRVSTTQAIKSVQTNQLPDIPKQIRKSVQTTLSSVQLVNKCRHRDVRKSRSVEFGMNKEEFRVEVLEWLDDVIRNPKIKNNAFDKLNAKLRKLSKIVDKPKFKTVKFKNVSPFCKDDENDSFKTISEDSKTMNYFRNMFPIEVFRAEVIPFKAAEAIEFKALIKDWFNRIPLKRHDFLERPVDREHMLTSFANILKDISLTTPDFLKNKLKCEIIGMLDEMPIDMKGSISKRNYLNVLANELVDKLCKMYGRKYKHGNNNIPNRVQFLSDVHPTVDGLKAFLSYELYDFLEKSHLGINPRRLDHIHNDLVDIIIEGMVAVRSEDDEQVAGEIVSLLQRSAGLYENQAVHVTNLLLKHFKAVLHTLDQPQVSIRPRWETVMMLPNSTVNNPTFDNSIGGITEEDIEANLNLYMDQLSQEIDEWLTSLRILRTHEHNFRQVVVNDLAGDIVDRHKYLELNPSCRVSDHEELEHLKFQIFKWINKLVGENYTETIQRAPELMRRIRAIPVPMLTRPGGGLSKNYRKGKTGQMFGPQGHGGSMMENPRQANFQGRSSGPGGFFSGPTYNTLNMSTMSIFGATGPEGSMTEQPQPISSRTGNAGAVGTPASPGSRVGQSIRAPKTMQELNDEFDEFVKSWVQEIPIATNTPEEQQLLPTMRTGLYNAVWKSITKLKCQPEVLLNPFYFEDKLDEEIEAIFTMIPQTPEFESQKHKLKVKLIEKTSHINDQITNALRSESFKQMLIDKADIYIPRLNTTEADENPIRLYEELEILYLAEEFILLTRFKDDDPVKANVYRNKLLQRVNDLVQEIKRAHGKEMKDINPEMYANDIVTDLHRVPLPSDDTIKQEADQILLGLEIERWYNDLPIARNNDIGEQLKRRRLRDALGKKIYEMEMSMNFSDSGAERELKHEVSRFLEKVPLGRNEDLNINFMVDELTNRLKNRPRSPGAARRVVFDETINYNIFKNIPCHVACSSKIEEAVTQASLLNQSGLSGISQAQSLAPNISQASSGGYPNAGAQLSQPGLQSFAPQVSSPGQAPGRSYTSGPADQSGQWMSLFQSGSGPPNVSQPQSGGYPNAGAQFSQPGLQNFAPNVSQHQSGGYPNAGAQFSQPGLQSFAPNVSQAPSGGYPNAGAQFSQPGLQSFAPNVSQAQSGGYSMFDQGRPLSSTLNAPDTGPQFSRQGPQSFAPNVSQAPSGGYPNAGAQFSQPGLQSFAPQISSPGQAPGRSYTSGPADQSGQWMSLFQSGSGPPNVSQPQSGGYPNAGAQFSQPGLQSFAPNVSQAQSGGYSMFDQGRPLSSTLNAPDTGPQFSRQGPQSFAPNVSQAQSGGYPNAGAQFSQPGLQSFAPNVSQAPSPGQAPRRSYTPGPVDQSGQWMSLFQSGSGPQALGAQNISEAGQSIHQAFPGQSIHQASPGQQSLGYQTFDNGRPVSSSLNRQASGGPEYFSMSGSSGQPIRDAHQVSMVQPGQNISVYAPQTSLQPSPANMSEQQWQSLLHSSSLPADQSMARQNVQGQSIRQASSPLQSFRDGTIPNSSVHPGSYPPNSIAQSAKIEHFTLPSGSSQGQASMMPPAQQNISSPDGFFQIPPQTASPRQQTAQGNLSGMPAFNTSQVGQGIPQVQVGGSPSPELYRSADRGPGPVGPSGTLSAYGQPGYSTPQQRMPSDAPPELRRRQIRETGIPQGGAVRRRLDLDDDDVVDKRVPCRCIERMRRYKKKMAGRYPCPGYEMEYREHHQPLRCFYPRFY